MSSIFDILLVGAIMAAVASFFGVFVILRRMALTVDALTHVALPGMALGILYSFNPYLGGFAALILGILGVLTIEERSGASVETAIGLIFTASLALGAILIPEESLIEALFGNINDINKLEFFVLLFSSLFIGAIIFAFFKPFVRISFSQEFAAAEGLKARKYYILYLFLLAGLVAIGIRLVGALLMSALIIFPAASAKNISRNISSMVILSMIIGIISSTLGLYIAKVFGFLPGATVVIVSLIIYILTLFLPKSD
jgi:ABC-type Mn2+/Zn2+ transport system permease subunit